MYNQDSLDDYYNFEGSEYDCISCEMRKNGDLSDEDREDLDIDMNAVFLFLIPMLSKMAGRLFMLYALRKLAER